LPSLQIVEGRIGIVHALTALGFAASNGEARRKIGEGAVKLNGVTIADPHFEVTLVNGEPVKISLGKKRHGLLRA
jgi:tyrosyl-tRNA synthetase